MNLADLRRDYSRSGIRRADLLPDAVAQFQLWQQQAIEAALPEPNAMTLATVDSDGSPAARIVLLKGLDVRGFHFYTNYESDKARQLEGHPVAALVFHWVELERQVRVRGRVNPLTRADTEAYFKGRPRGSQLGAWVSRQSQVLPNREALEARLMEVEQQFPGLEVPPPPHWGGFTVAPQTIEFWQGRPSRLHDRFLYTLRSDSTWKLDRLAP